MDAFDEVACRRRLERVADVRWDLPHTTRTPLLFTSRTPAGGRNTPSARVGSYSALAVEYPLYHNETIPVPTGLGRPDADP